MKKGIQIGTLLKSLHDEVFSGSCSIMLADHAITLVWKSGEIILAGFDEVHGDLALEKVVSEKDAVADASLSMLSEAQLRLTLEFNPAAQVLRRSVARKVISTRPAEERTAGVPGRPISDMPTEPLIMEETHADTVAVPPPPASGSDIGKPPEPIPAPVTTTDEETEEGDTCSLVDRDLNALAAMDLDGMSEKIRQNYKKMIEKLHLEYLIEDRVDEI